MAARYCSRSLASILLRSGRDSARKFLPKFGRARSPSAPDGSAVRPYLKNDDRVPHVYEVFHARGVPVGEANTAVARSAAHGLRIIRAVDANPWLVQPHP